MRRVALTAVLLSGALFASHASAAPTPQVTDPKGDYPVAGADIVSLTLSTVKKKTLVIALELAGPASPATPIPYAYQINFMAGSCDWRVNYFGANDEVSGGCRGDNSSAPSGVKINGNTLTFSVPTKGAFKLGTKITAFAIYSAPGGVLSGSGPGAAGDTATGDATYVVK
ncbi:MAG TPA: hypothetical protein VNB94_03930 [Mycobacteriales bacterium]|nr:hypothetical protein [Mycobacteriales bacterium]